MKKSHTPLFRVPVGKNSQVSVVPHVVPGDVILLCRQRHGLHTLLQTQYTEKQTEQKYFWVLNFERKQTGQTWTFIFRICSHISFKEQVQQHPFGADLGKVQRLVQSVSQSNELWDFFKSSILIRLDDILWGLVRGNRHMGRGKETWIQGIISRWYFQRYRKSYNWVKWTYIFLVRVEKPEGEITGLGGCSKLAQRLSIAC